MRILQIFFQQELQVHRGHRFLPKIMMRIVAGLRKEGLVQQQMLWMDHPKLLGQDIKDFHLQITQVRIGHFG